MVICDAAGELIFAGQDVDLIFIAQPVDQVHQLPGEIAALPIGLIPDAAPGRIIVLL